MYLQVPVPHLAFRKHDIDRNELLSPSELESYFYKHYMKTFEGIDIDPKFITATLKYIQKHDTDNDGMSPEELLKAVLKSEDDGKKTDREPHYYPEQELWMIWSIVISM